ncbi:MAG: phosphoribosylaminoimidazolesuccinocarboxamide synthase [Promethearchaeota archaeon]
MILGHPASLVSKGKNKDIYALDDERLGFVFTSRISAFDGVVGTTTPKRAELLCECSAMIFTLFEKLDIPTHLLQWGSDQMIVRKLVRLPFEFIVRNVLMGSAFKRYARGELELPEGMTGSEYEEFPKPFFEITTKLEKHDRIVTGEEIPSIARKHMPGYQDNVIEIAMRKARFTTEKIGLLLREVFAAAGFVFIDGKLEYGLDKEGKLFVIDSFGPDEFRACTPSSLARTLLNIQDSPEFYDKEFLRRQLRDAPKEGREEVVEQVAGELEQRYEKITSALREVIKMIIKKPKALEKLQR